MAGLNAGIRRNTRQGEIAKPFQVRLTKTALNDFHTAARASGNLSYSLYLERIIALLEAEHGSLPIFNDDEETHTAAA